MALTAETLKMARIAGLECADATNLMTAALRGFNMEINETSAQRVNDVYSELAAITAADTNEIATAMTKTASIAASANMELETTAALLAQMIETTREPAETAGTAMKTIVARFTEMKKAASDVVSVDGEEVSVNKVDAALASVGVSLKNTKGEFRDLDDVLLELASKWNSLDIMSQRYIATTAAGSRQQSRFIAMMQDYERTMELVDAAYNSAGSSSQQFAKTQESLESKMARLKNAWDTFLMGIADDKIVKGFVDILTGLINAFNKITEKADGLGGSMLRVGAVFLGLRAANAIVKKLITNFVTLKGEAGKLTFLQSLT
jgi:TP901 family phage tail tape measure protein